MSKRIASRSSYTNQVFKQLMLDQAQLEDSEFYDCAFEACSMVESVLRGCRFNDCLFKGCDLSLVQIPGSRFAATRFDDSKLVGINWTMADWSTSKLSAPIAFHSCAINYATFIGLSLPGIEIKACAAVDVDFREADLSGVDFAGTDLDQSMFDNTNLEGADLSRARNYQIDPGRNTVKEARFAMPEAMSLLYSLDIILVDDGLE